MKVLSALLVSLLIMGGMQQAIALDYGNVNYALGAGDTIKISVFQHPDLTLDTRVAENGNITYPLVGSLQVGGLTLANAERKIATSLKQGGYVKDPQVNITLLQGLSNQVSVLGQVNRPGRIPLETLSTRLSEVLAMAGGITNGGSDIVVITGLRDGKAFRREVDFPAIFSGNDQSQNIFVTGGDVIYVNRAQVYYIYGEVQKPGVYRIERGMTVQQALAQGGGVTARGTESGIKLFRKKPDGGVDAISPNHHDPVQPNDVINIRESIF